MTANSTPRPLNEAEAKALLSASAPDLLAVIKEYMNWGARKSESDLALFDRKFRAAIDKAEGR